MARGYGKNGKLYIVQSGIVGEIQQDGKIIMLNVFPRKAVSFSISDFILFAKAVGECAK